MAIIVHRIGKAPPTPSGVVSPIGMEALRKAGVLPRITTPVLKKDPGEAAHRPDPRAMPAPTSAGGDGLISKQQHDPFVPPTTWTAPWKVTQLLVANYFGVNPEIMTSERRFRMLVLARFVAMYLMKEVCGMTYPAIGRRFKRHHTTVLSGIKNVQYRMQHNTSFETEIDSLKRKLEEVLAAQTAR